MIELIVINHLREQLPGIQVTAVDTESKPAQRVTVERTGGGEDEHIRSAMIAVQSYGATQYAAAQLHEDVLQAMQTINALPQIGSCDLNQEYNFPDLETKENRYQAVYDIVYY